MTVSRSTILGVLAFALIGAIALFDCTPVYAQEYKESYNSGMEAARAKNYSSALENFAAAADGAKAEGDTQTERMARKLIAQIEYAVGRSAMKAEDYPTAIQHFDSGIAQDPTNAKNILAKASVLKRMDNFDEAMAVYAQAAAVASEGGDTKTARQAQTTIREQYIFLATSALNRHGTHATRADANEALEHLTTLQSYVDADSDVYYYLAEVHKIKGEFQESVSLADQALAAHNGSRSSKARIYFVKGEAHMALGQSTAAVAAFQNARFGSYRASAVHFIEELGSTSN